MRNLAYYKKREIQLRSELKTTETLLDRAEVVNNIRFTTRRIEQIEKKSVEELF